jgi:hypothetical protein
MITQSTHQPSKQERLAEYMSKKVYVPELNFSPSNIFYKQFNKEQK